MSKMQIGQYLFLRLKQMGLSHIFGVPGDFNLQLLEQLKDIDGLEFTGTCNELNASYAADGYARIHGVGAMLTTYGVGDLSAICGLAGACAEHVPVVMISGTPPLYVMESRLRVHHSLAEGNFDNISICLKQFTCNSTRLTPANAAYEIDRVLLSCWREKCPVYIQVPSNISYLEIEVPEEPLRLSMPCSDRERLGSAAARIISLLEKAKRPLMLIDAETDRCSMANDLYAIAAARHIPYIVFRSGKGIMPESGPLYLGMYDGVSQTSVPARALQETDCLIATAPCFVEASPMAVPQNLPASSQIYIRAFDVTVEGDVYEGVTAGELIRKVAESIRPSASYPDDVSPADGMEPVVPKEDAPLTQAYLWRRIERFLRDGDLICAENGTSLTALTGLKLPDHVRYVNQPIWGSIGYSLPALLGAMTAEPARRGLLFIGDGSFQLTAQELSTILNRGLKPIIFLLNNRGYTIERYILGMHSAYNDIANWKYNELPSVVAPGTECYHVSAATEEELEQALHAAEKADTPCFIELQLRPDDAPAAMKVFGARTAELDYGPRGPQHVLSFSKK